MIPTAITAGASRVASGLLGVHAIAITPAGSMEHARSCLSIDCGLPCEKVRSAPAIVFSGPAQRSLMLWPARSPSRLATLSIESSDSFVASAVVSIATGWSEPVPGRELHPLKSSAFHGALIRQLELDGFSVVEEAATDVIAAAQARGTAEPWTVPSFIDAIADLQKQRQIRASNQPGDLQFHDRSVVCTAVLALYLGYPTSVFLMRELERVSKEAIYEKRAFFIRNLGFITPTEARRISFEETLRFEKVHEETYRSFGFELFSVERGDLLQRVSVIKAAIC